MTKGKDMWFPRHYQSLPRGLGRWHDGYRQVEPEPRISRDDIEQRTLSGFARTSSLSSVSSNTPYLHLNLALVCIPSLPFPSRVSPPPRVRECNDNVGESGPEHRATSHI
ncbi:uncharacterized protein CCOS01_00902 [Colletotrichum costaricense]|uniref:Uncharacterized protein n=2 Tax=Colletotrichum acutatum species complex TaxID=2707335 RepID=A0AAI9ZAE7_9PEZI|nr:uncharacterized protein CCOS01_00902 [Colletotrichum costaricense]XP_060385109.1 uncharacterized protein CTAM01_04434 [Colletotrichum tamarilloi]KAK1504204.1 hypothetical protein CTAM01_04434 [Colletotrichum tamarilloi]KAK1539588.1 hypothetical protein CCOS01_00902 [Colletotrichum costaricense]